MGTVFPHQQAGSEVWSCHTHAYYVTCTSLIDSITDCYGTTNMIIQYYHDIRYRPLVTEDECSLEDEEDDEDNFSDGEAMASEEEEDDDIDSD